MRPIDFPPNLFYAKTTLGPRVSQKIEPNIGENSKFNAAFFCQKFGFFQGPWKPARGPEIGIPSAPANSRRPARSFWKCAKSGLGPPVSRDIASKSGEKRWKKGVRVKFLLLLLNKIVVLTFDRKWIHHQKWVQIKCCQYSSISPPSFGVSLRPLVSIFLPFFCQKA